MALDDGYTSRPQPSRWQRIKCAIGIHTWVMYKRRPDQYKSDWYYCRVCNAYRG